MSELDKLTDDTFDIKDRPELVWIRVQDAEKLILAENPKRHDIGGLVTAISRYGFQEIAKYDATVGGIKAGNGRIEALAVMEREGKAQVPRGIGIEKETGAWVMPLTVGVDARSRSEAFAYLIDSNNLTMSGGDLTGFDIAQMWDSGYGDLLSGLDELPVSVDGDLLDALLGNVDFQPVDEADQPQLDTKSSIICPKCGAEFVPG